MRSIRTRLLLALLGLVAVVSVLAGVLTYRRVLAETSDLLDYQLRQMALSLESQIPLAPNLPPQNGTGNGFKVVQGVPVRIAFDKDEDTRLLRSGMSVVVDIDTGHSRWPSFLGGAKEPAK